MYNSLKGWLNIPLVRKPFLDMDNAGDKTYMAEESLMCYADNKITKVITSKGTEVNSSITLYVEGDKEFGSYDSVVYQGFEYNIVALGSLFNGEGIRDIWVVYI